MSTVLNEPVVRAYLDELRRLLAGSPDRDLVVDGIALHIQEAAMDSPGDPIRVRAILDELGDPAVIAAESAPEAVRATRPFLERRVGGVLVILLLAVGGFVVPVIGWIGGVGLLWASKSWTRIDKVIGTAFVPVALGVVLLVEWLGWLGVVPATTCIDGCTAAAPVLGFPGHLVLLIGYPVLTAAVSVFLLLRFRPRR